MFPTFVIADLIRVTMIGETAFGHAPPYASRNNGQSSSHFLDRRRSS
ncbi:hypothetical protein J2X38_000470 [Sphingopyxis sp. BE235]|nr:hypothetical protein [Sphingopyxis sp. BE235]MDR7179380.1 hypothetical protein [Sphingopyxis sp. BE249]